MWDIFGFRYVLTIGTFLVKLVMARRSAPTTGIQMLYASRGAIPNHIWLQFVAMELSRH